MAFTSDSPRFTLPPGRVQSLNPTAWRTNSTLCSASSIQAMTDTSLVGRVLAIFGRGLGIQLIQAPGTLGPTTQKYRPKITQDNFQRHQRRQWIRLGLCTPNF